MSFEGYCGVLDGTNEGLLKALGALECVCFLTEKDEELEFLKKLKDDFKDTEWAWLILNMNDTRIVPRVLEVLKLTNEEKKKKLFMMKNVSEKWIFEGDVESHEEAKKWLELYQKGEAKQLHSSAERTENDVDPTHPTLGKLTYYSFFEIALDEKKEVFVDLYADWCGPCRRVGPMILLLSEVFSDIPEIIIAKFDVDENDTPKDHFPEPGIPNMKFFPIGSKDKPIKYAGDRSGKDLVEFIGKHAKTKFDVEAKVKQMDELEKYKGKMDILKKIKEDAEKKLKIAKAGYKEHKIAESRLIDEYLGKVNEAFKIKAPVVELEKLASEWEAEELVKELEEVEKVYLICTLKSVVKVHSVEEYKKLLEDNKDKILVVDYFATWCGPCVYIGPLFADLSEKYDTEKVLFLKVDSGPLRQVITDENVGCYPTFKFFKGGKEVHKMEGADIKGIENKVNELLK